MRLRACKQGRQPCASFAHAGPLAERVLLGNVALLAGKPIEWDRKAMAIVNEPGATKCLRRECRRGRAL